MTSPLDSPQWLPVLVRQRDHVVEWAWAGDMPAPDPFFAETVERLLRHPFNRLLRAHTDLDGLLAFAREHPGLPLRGIVAHVSRCGSTLVSSWLGSSDDRLSLSEPGPLDAVLRLTNEAIDGERHVALVRAMVAALAQPRRGSEQSAYVKLDAWDATQLPLLRAAFPDTPILAIARDPVEVLVSADRHRGAHMVPGALPPELFGMSWEDIATLPPPDFMARVLTSIVEALLHGQADLYVDFADLLDRRGEILELFGVDADAESTVLDDISGRHAKAPERPYEDDRADKQAAATAALREAAQRIVGPAYKQFLQLARPTVTMR